MVRSTLWLAVLVFGPATLGYLTLVLLSYMRLTGIVVWYLLFLVVWFAAALPIVAVTWVLPAPARAVLAAVVVYVALLFLPFASTMARYPLHVIRCRHLPLVGTRFAAAYTYTVPGSPSYAVTPLDTDLFCTRQQAADAGFREKGGSVAP